MFLLEESDLTTMEILVFYPDPAKLNFINLCLESQLHIEVRSAHNFGEAVKYLLDHNNVNLIVAGETDQLPALLKYLLSVGSKIPIILVGPESTENGNVSFISPGLPILKHIKNSEIPTELPKVIKENYEELIKDSVSKDQPYCRINVELLCDVTPLTGDVFVRLSNIKFVKIFNAGTVFTQKDLNRFLGIKKIDYLYIQKSTSQDFVSRLHGRLLNLENSTQEGDEALLSTVGQVHETVQDLTRKIGFTEPVIELAKTQVKLAMKAIGKFPRLTRIFEGSLLQGANYTSRHSLMLAHLSCAIATKMGWHSDSTFQKLVIAAFLHDITLTKPEYAQVAGRLGLEEAKRRFTPSEVKNIEQHPFAAAQLVDKILEIPGDIYLVVLQHHERPDGSGFPSGLRGSAIAPLAAIFITAHDIVDCYLEQGNAFSMEDFWRDRLAHYSMGTFKKIAKCFHDEDDSQSAA